MGGAREAVAMVAGTAVAMVAGEAGSTVGALKADTRVGPELAVGISEAPRHLMRHLSHLVGHLVSHLSHLVGHLVSLVVVGHLVSLVGAASYASYACATILPVEVVAGSVAVA